MTCVSEQICCGLCIYRRQFGLRICCGNDDDEAESTRRGRRKTHIVLAAQYNRAFDDSAPAVDKSSAVNGDELPSSAKKNGVVTGIENDSSTVEQTGEDSVPPSASDADLEVDATVANAEADSNVLEDVAAGEVHSRDVATDTADVENVNEAQANIADGELKASVNDGNDGGDDINSDCNSADLNPSSDDCVTPRTGNQTPVTGNEASSSATSKETVEPDFETCATDAASTCETRDQSPVTENVLTDNTTEPEVVFTLPETEKNCRTKAAPVQRRWRSMGAGSRLRRVSDTVSCDKAVSVHEDDLVVQPEPEIVNGNESDALSEATTKEDRNEEVKETAGEGNGEENMIEDATQTVSAGESPRDEPRMLGDLVLDLDLDELGIHGSQDIKPEEVSDL